jgi:FkbM family methyltransferase
MHQLRRTLLAAVRDTPFEGVARRLHGLLARDRGAKYDRETFMVMQRVLGRSSNCIDVGAYRGEILRQMLKLSPDGRVFAFEPVPDNCRYLTRKYPKAEIFNAALADTVGTSEFFHVTGRPARSGLKKQNYPDPEERVETITVKVETLDNVIPSATRIDFIKIDVEGAELHVLRGGERLIRQNRPVIVFEHGPGASSRYGVSSEALYDFVVNETGCRLSTMARWLADREPYSRPEFLDDAVTNKEFYFIAYC